MVRFHRGGPVVDNGYPQGKLKVGGEHSLLSIDSEADLCKQFIGRRQHGTLYNQNQCDIVTRISMILYISLCTFSSVLICLNGTNARSISGKAQCASRASYKIRFSF